ncbi:MAG: helix-turn-helix domain-containing protein [Cyanobacteria bacterium P01_A01_bin.135]
MTELDLPTWEYQMARPSSAVKPWVSAYSGYREAIGYPICRLEVPKARVILILGFGDGLRIRSADAKLKPSQYRAFVVGLNERSLLVEHGGAQCGIEVELVPWAAQRLFGRAASELAQQVTALEDVWGSRANSLVNQLGEMPSWEERFHLVEKFLATRFTSSNQTARQEIQWAWKQLEQRKGCIPIRNLAKSIGWSDRYFATCFKEQIGITPKAAARRLRFNHAQRLLSSPEPVPLSEIAATCGYSDQSHFTREFRAFSQCSPAVYRKAQFETLAGTSGNAIQLVERSNLFKT